jgi:hypothetical protein
MRQYEIMVDVEQRELRLYAAFALAQRVDPTPDRRHALADIEIEPFDKGGIDLPATGNQDLLDRRTRAKHHLVVHPNHTLPPVPLAHVRIGSCASIVRVIQ